jgi:hypothetical protein
LRPERVRDERFYAGCFDHGASDDGGRDEFDESAALSRSSSPTRSVSAATMPFNSASSARNPAFSARNAAFSAASEASDTNDTLPDHTARSTRHAEHHANS